MSTTISPIAPPSTAIYGSLTRNLQALEPSADVVGKVERFGAFAFHRAAVVDVSKALADAVAASGDDLSPVSTFHVYADVAYASTIIKIPASCFNVKIFARELFTQTSPGKPLQISIDGNATVFSVYTGLSRGNIDVALVKKGVAEHVVLSFAQDSGNALIQAISGKSTVLSKAAVPTQAFDYMSLTDLILDNGEMQQAGLDRTNDHLPKLLTFQMLLAESLQQRQPDVAFKLASFVLTVTATISKALDWHAQASSFLASQVVGSASSPRRYVPNRDVSVARSVLVSRLSAAQAFEVAFQNFKTLGIQVENTQTLAHAALDAADDAVKAYKFLADEAKKSYDASRDALAIAKKRFVQLEATMPAAQKKFKDGIEEFRKKQIIMAVVDGLIALVEVTASIAAACVFPPAATGVVAESGAILPIIEIGAETAETVSTIAKIFSKLKELFEVMEPALEKFEGVVEAVDKTLTLLENFKSLDSGAETLESTPLPVDNGDDAINGSAQWDMFDVQTAAVFDAIKEYDIDGADDYAVLLKQMVILGKAVLAAQLAVSNAASNYTTALTQSLLSAQQAGRLRNAVAKLQGDPYAIGIFRRSMFDQLINLRSWVFMDMASYVLAYSWFALDDVSPVILDPTRAIATLMGDAATIEAAGAQAAAVLRPQRRTIVLSSTQANGPLALSADDGGSWIADLSKTRSVRLTVSPDHALFATFMRIRVLGMKIVLQGAKVGQGASVIGMTVTRGRTMVDLRSPRSPSDVSASALPPSTSSSATAITTAAASTSGQDIVQTLDSSSAGRIVAFAGEPLKFGVEYIPDLHGLTADRFLMSGVPAAGQLTARESSSLFADWTIKINDDVDLSSIGGLTVEAECEVSSI